MRAVVCLAPLLLLTAVGCTNRQEPAVLRDIEPQIGTRPGQVDPPGGSVLEIEEDMEPESDPDDR